MALDIQPLDIQPLEASGKLDIQPLDIQPIEDNKEFADKQMADMQGRINDAPSNLQGGAEALVGTVAGLPGMIAGGLHGLSTLVAGQGLDQASKNMRSTQDLLSYKPFSKKGAEFTENLGTAMAKPGEAARDLATPYLGELGGTNAQIATDVLMNLVEPVALVKGFKGKGKAAKAEAAQPSLKDVAEQVAADNAEGKSAPLFPETDAHVLAQKNDTLAKNLADSTLKEQAKNIQERAGFNQKFAERLAKETEKLQDKRYKDTAANVEQIQKKMEEEQTSERPNLTSLEDETGQQSLFDQGDQMGQKNQFNADGNADWRIDENGMPVRVDKSMEALNVEQPLQHNLWGDELGPALGQDRSLTQAIDSVGPRENWAQRRGMINRLGGRGQELLAGNDLNAARMEANGPKLPFDEQTTFQPTNPMETALAGVMPEPTPTKSGPEVVQNGNEFIAMKDGVQTGRLVANMTPEQYQQLKARGIDEPAAVDIVKVSDEVKGQGHGKALYDAFAKAFDGDIRPHGNTTPDAWKVWKRNFPEQTEAYVKETADRIVDGGDAQRIIGDIRDPEIQQKVYEQAERKTAFVQAHESGTGATAKLEPLAPEERAPKTDSVAAPISPETIAAKTTQTNTIKLMHNGMEAFKDFLRIRTKEEALAKMEANGFKDIQSSAPGRQAAPGGNMYAAITGSPAIRFAATVYRDARVAADKFSRTYITGKDGLSETWTKMNNQERVRVQEILLDADKHQIELTPEIMNRMGMSEKQQRYATAFREADNALLGWWNKNLTESGMKPVTARVGHFPSRFTGSYKAIINVDGKPIAVATGDTKAQIAAAKKYYAEKYPNSTAFDLDRRGLAGVTRASDTFSGMNDIIQALAARYPDLAEIQSAAALVSRNEANALFNFNMHEKKKLGVGGHEGNKPWLSPEENAREAHNAIINYFEQGAEHHAMFNPTREVRAMMTDPRMQQMPKTLKYLESYTKQQTGANIAPLGRAINTALDSGIQLVSYLGAPVGVNNTLKTAGFVKNKMSQIFMGYGNYGFTIAQLLQPVQTALPMAAHVSVGGIAPSFTKGNTAFMLLQSEALHGHKIEAVPALMREAYEYAVDRGMLSFSEMERAHEGGKTKLGRLNDKVAEKNMDIGERYSRTPTFMSFVDMLEKNAPHLSKEDKFGIAENMTQASMIDYAAGERPMMYQGLGVLGQFAGGLTTFKHGIVGQNIYHGKKAFTKGQMAPLAASLGVMVALAGVTGLPGFDELETMYGMLTNQFMGGKRSIKDDMLGNLGNWAKYGVVSDASGIAVASKFSSADMIPDYDQPGRALSPQLAGAVDLGKTVLDMVSNGADAQSVRNAIIAFSPNSVKRLSEQKFAQDEKGNLIGKDGQVIMPLSQDEWKLRSATGQRTLREVDERDNTFRNREALKADADKIKDLGTQLKRAEINGTLTQEKAEALAQEAAARGADPKEFLSNLGNPSIMKNFTEKQRAAGVTPKGIPNNAPAVHRFSKFYPQEKK